MDAVSQETCRHTDVLDGRGGPGAIAAGYRPSVPVSGTYWGEVRSIGEPVQGNGRTSGIIPFVRVMDSLTLAISQGSLRRGSAAVYIDVHHPEIEEFIEIRKPSGDFNRKSLNLHHGVAITDEFMAAVRDDAPFALRSPATGATIRTISARELWQKILETRLQTGEPYLLFVDTANRQLAEHQKALGLKVRQSNLCSEILLPTGRDQRGQMRTAVCCLASVNLARWDEWRDDRRFIEDVFRFLDNALEAFIADAPESMQQARYSAMRERSVGLGAMGFHSYLQQRGIPFESALAKSWNRGVFEHLRAEADRVSALLAEERGPCPDAADAGERERFSHKLAIAPTASISIITEAERNLLTQVFRFFTQSDVEVQDNYMERYARVFRPTEVKMMLAAFTNMETVHIVAYALLLETLGMPDTEFAAFLDYEAMRDKHDYMQEFGVANEGDILRTLAMFGAFTEGLQLFASFAILLNFPRHNKMRGMGQIVSWSVRDESLHCEGILRLFHSFAEETGALTKAVREDIVECARTVVKLEDRFIDLAFEMGPLDGLDANGVKRYIRYIADWRLQQLGLPAVYHVAEHPLPWLTGILNGVEHANFFETRATEYAKAATAGSWHGEEGAWSMFEERIRQQRQHALPV